MNDDLSEWYFHAMDETANDVMHYWMNGAMYFCMNGAMM